ncbi:MAG: DUF3822 family protein [Bacteroidetes bacterium]|nr:DUF3822 family protein [Bacteroidota bacterium]
MSEISNSTINYHTYSLHEGDTLLTQVAKVICILQPRGLTVAGFSEHGDLLMVHYGDYSQTLPTWILDFYEHRFLDEPLLFNPDNVIAVFVVSDKYLLIPDELYDEGEAVKWLNKLYFVEGNEVLSCHHLQENSSKYMFAYPGTMKSLIGRYFTRARVLPLAMYQFFKPYRSDHSIQCTITQEHAVATLYKNRSLHWHQVFEYQNGEDIAYQLKHACRQFRINPDTAELNSTVAYRGLNYVLNDLCQYFPQTREFDQTTATNNRQWAATLSLLQQLYSCVL